MVVSLLLLAGLYPALVFQCRPMHSCDKKVKRWITGNFSKGISTARLGLLYFVAVWRAILMERIIAFMRNIDLLCICFLVNTSQSQQAGYVTNYWIISLSYAPSVRNQKTLRSQQAQCWWALSYWQKAKVNLLKCIHPEYRRGRSADISSIQCRSSYLDPTQAL